MRDLFGSPSQSRRPARDRNNRAHTVMPPVIPRALFTRSVVALIRGCETTFDGTNCLLTADRKRHFGKELRGPRHVEDALNAGPPTIAYRGASEERCGSQSRAAVISRVLVVRRCVATLVCGASPTTGVASLGRLATLQGRSTNKPRKKNGTVAAAEEWDSRTRRKELRRTHRASDGAPSTPQWLNC
jgi:hypothetical protein